MDELDDVRRQGDPNNLSNGGLMLPKYESIRFRKLRSYVTTHEYEKPRSRTNVHVFTECLDVQKNKSQLVGDQVAAGVPEDLKKALND